jgi:phosphate transport system protein
LVAFVWRDVELARAIPAEDQEVDRLYNQIDRELLEHVVADPTPSTIDRANYLLWAAHNLERAADRVVNLCERVVFTVTGEMVEMNVGDGLFADHLERDDSLRS